MTDELKSVLAVALPVGALLVGALVIYGPGARLEGARSNDPRVYEVTYVEAWAPKRTTTARIVADTRLSKAELLAKLLERDGVSPDLKIVKVRSEAI